MTHTGPLTHMPASSPTTQPIIPKVEPHSASYCPLNASPLQLLCTHVCSSLILHCSLFLFLPVKLLSILHELLKYHFLYQTFQNLPSSNNRLFFPRVLFIFLLQCTTNLSHLNATFQFLSYPSPTFYGLISMNHFVLQ